MEPTSIHTQRRISKSDAARQLEVTTKAIDRMIADGELKAVPMPSGVRNIILQSSVDALVAKLNAAVVG